MCRRTEEEVGPTVGLQTPHFGGFFNVSVQASTRDQPFYTVIPTPPQLVAFNDTLGYGGHNLDLIPGPSRGQMALEALP